MADVETAMTPMELCAALQLSRSTFYRYQAIGKFDRFELVPRLGPHRYSRKAVQAYLDRERPTSSMAPLRVAQVS